MTEERALVPVEQYRVVTVRLDTLREVIARNLGANGNVSRWDLDQVRVPTGGATTWSIPTIDGEKESKELVGVIVGQRDTRAYWSIGMEQSGGGSPPDCSSEDGIVGVGNPGGDCGTCGFAEWGSKGDNRRGQACKSMKVLYILRPNSILPLVMALPPTSIAPLRKYMLRLASEGMLFYSVVTRLTLRRVTAGAFTYSQVEPSVAMPVPPEHEAALRSYIAAIEPALMRASVPVEQDAA